MSQFFKRESMDISLLDEEFLATLSEQKSREIYAKIIALDINELPIDEIEGKVTGGSINIDGTSAVQRTCSLSLITDTVDINDFYWGIKTKFKLEIGVKNNLTGEFAPTENGIYPEIVWFKQGTFFVTAFNTSISTNSCTISLSGKDKMCMLNGELGGQLFASIDFGKEEYKDKVMVPASIDASTSDSLLANKYYKKIHPKVNEDKIQVSDENENEFIFTTDEDYVFVIDAENGEYYKRDNKYQVYRESALSDRIASVPEDYQGNIYAGYRIIRNPDDLFRQVDSFLFADPSGAIEDYIETLDETLSEQARAQAIAERTEELKGVLSKTAMLNSHEEILNELKAAKTDILLTDLLNDRSETKQTVVKELIKQNAFEIKKVSDDEDGIAICLGSLDKAITFYDQEKVYQQAKTDMTRKTAAAEEAEQNAEDAFEAMENAYYVTGRETEAQIMTKFMRKERTLSAQQLGSIAGEEEEETSAFSGIQSNYYILEDLYEIGYEYSVKHITLEKIIREAVHAYAKEPYHNIIINDLDEYGLEQLTFKGDTPIYGLRNLSTQQFQIVMEAQAGNLKDIVNTAGFQQDTLTSELSGTTGDIIYYSENASYTDENGIVHTGAWIVWDGITTLSPSIKRYTVAKFEYGNDVGYRITDLTYPGELVSSVGENLTAILDKIKNMLGNFEYFYDVNGRFIFQRKRTYVDTVWSQLVRDSDEEEGSYVDYANTSRRKFSFNFEGNRLVTAIQNTPVLTNLKNDFTVWGKRKGVSGQELPIHARYAIDVKPKVYRSLNGRIYISNALFSRVGEFNDETERKAYIQAEQAKILTSFVEDDIELSNNFDAVSNERQAAIDAFQPNTNANDWPKDRDGNDLLTKPRRQDDKNEPFTPGWWEINDWGAYYKLLVGSTPHGSMKFYSRNNSSGCVPRSTIPGLGTSGDVWLVEVTHYTDGSTPDKITLSSHNGGSYSEGVTVPSDYYKTVVDENDQFAAPPTDNSEPGRYTSMTIKGQKIYLEKINTEKQYIHYPYGGCVATHTYDYFNLLTTSTDQYSIKYYFYNPYFPAVEFPGGYSQIYDQAVSEAAGEFVRENEALIYIVDWRELIYQMALDYFAAQGCSKTNPIYNLNNELVLDNPDHFLPILAQLNKGFYPTGYTGYEQYYTDIQGFWRQLYNPFYVPSLVWSQGGYEDIVQRKENSPYYSKTKSWKDAVISDCEIDYYFDKDKVVSIWNKINANNEDVLRRLDSLETGQKAEAEEEKAAYIASIPELEAAISNQYESDYDLLIEYYDVTLPAEIQAEWIRAYAGLPQDYAERQKNEQATQLSLLEEKFKIEKKRYELMNSTKLIRDLSEQENPFRGLKIQDLFSGDNQEATPVGPITTLDDDGYLAYNQALKGQFSSVEVKLKSDYINNTIDNSCIKYQLKPELPVVSGETEEMVTALYPSEIVAYIESINKWNRALFEYQKTYWDKPLGSDEYYFIYGPAAIQDAILKRYKEIAAKCGGVIRGTQLKTKEMVNSAYVLIDVPGVDIVGDETEPEETQEYINNYDIEAHYVSVEFAKTSIMDEKEEKLNSLTAKRDADLQAVKDRVNVFDSRIQNITTAIENEKQLQETNFHTMQDKWVAYGLSSSDLSQNFKKVYWSLMVFDSPETLNFWFDFLDGGTELQQFSVPVVGDRTKVINDDKARAIIYREIPDVIVYDKEEQSVEELKKRRQSQTGYTFIEIPKGYSQYFTISYRGTSVKNKIDELLYQFAYCIENISITALPIYQLEPNTRIYVQDTNTNIEGEYLVSRISLPLTYNGTMSITATKAPERLY